MSVLDELKAEVVELEHKIEAAVAPVEAVVAAEPAKIEAEVAPVVTQVEAEPAKVEVEIATAAEAELVKAEAIVKKFIVNGQEYLDENALVQEWKPRS